MNPAKMSAEYDLFISYARKDNKNEWISKFVEALLAEYRSFTGGRELKVFFDPDEIRGGDDWRMRIKGSLARSKFFLAFISPNYFNSEWCRREWQGWIETEVAKHILTLGAAPVSIVEVPGMNDGHKDDDVARKIAKLCGQEDEGVIIASAQIVKILRRRTPFQVQPFYKDGLKALLEADIKKILSELAQRVNKGVEAVELAEQSETDLAAYNTNFTGRLDELFWLREALDKGRAGVVSGIHGLGGIGKTELALTYAHAYAGLYPGGRFMVHCEGKTRLSDAIIDSLAARFGGFISDEERKDSQLVFRRIRRGIEERIDKRGAMLLLLDNVSDSALLGPEHADALTMTGLHLLATTRLEPQGKGRIGWLTLDRLSDQDALTLLEKHCEARTCGPLTANERKVAREVVKLLGGFTLAVELVGVWLGSDAVSVGDYLELLKKEGLGALDSATDDPTVQLRRHNYEKCLAVILGPTLASLSAPEKRVMEYAALLPADSAPMNWLRDLVVADFPSDMKAVLGEKDPWIAIKKRLTGLGLIKADGGVDDECVARTHRLVQDLLVSEMTEDEKLERQKALRPVISLAVSRLLESDDWARKALEVDACALLATREIALGSDHLDVADLLDEIADLLGDANRVSEAELFYRRSLNIHEKSQGPKHPDVAASLSRIASMLYFETSRFEEAELLLKRSLHIREKSLGPNHLDVADSLADIARVLMKTNRSGEAEILCRRALDICEKSPEPGNQKIIWLFSQIAGILGDLNCSEDAEVLCRRSVGLSEKLFGPDDTTTSVMLDSLARLLVEMDRLEEAELLYRRSLDIQEKSPRPDRDSVAVTLGGLESLLRKMNRLEEAEKLCRRSLAIREKSLGPDHPTVAHSLECLAHLLRKTNRRDEAEKLSRRADDIRKKSDEYGKE